MKDTSGPAFPLPAEWNGPELITYAQKGMTKREFIAMHIDPPASCNAYDIEDNARWSVAYADALLMELEKLPPSKTRPAPRLGVSMTVTLLHVCDSLGHWSVVGVFATTEKAEIEASLRKYTGWSTSEWGVIV